MATTTGDVVGLALPALRELGGYFRSADRYDTAWSDLMIALFTPIGSRIGERSFGSAVTAVLFEPNTQDNAAHLEQLVYETTAQYCPHVRLDGVTVLSDNRVVSLRIRFGLSRETGYAERRVEISKADIARLVGAV
jgi:phage baseplate assembly protein W